MPTVTKNHKGETIYCGPTYVVDRKLCPWFTCFWPRDWGRMNSQGRWIKDGKCNTNARFGCPRSPQFKSCCDNPRFVRLAKGQRSTCQSCGLKVPYVIAKFLREQDTGVEETDGDI